MSCVTPFLPAEGTTATVELLTGIWSRMLQVSPVLPDSDFFDLGGDSLLAVNLFLEIERVTGHHLPITAIYDAPTVAKLAALMERETPAKFSPLVLLQDGGRGEPLFIVHGVGGTVIDLAALGRLIRSDGPVYAIQARGVDGQDSPLRTIDEMADYYVDAVREISPHGPYRLAGYSFGGVVAVEMARRLSPENVDKLILLDSFAHPQTWPSASRLQVSLAKLARRLFDMKRLTLRQLMASVVRVAGRSVVRRGQKEKASERTTSLKNWLGTISPDLPLPLRETRIAADAALVAYWPQYYPGAVTFLRAGITSDVFPSNPRAVWRRLVGEMTVCTVEGSHRSIVGEHAAGTAKAISASIAPPRKGAGRFLEAAPADSRAASWAMSP
jgi:acetoacetyl-CoA synthetase